MTKTVSSWSHSKLGDFEKCRKLTYLKHVARIPEPERPLPPGKTEHANDRGSRVHDSCEHYIDGTSDTLAPEADKHFGFQIDLLRRLYADGQVSLEGEWGMDIEWGTAEWKSAWLRLKLDVCVFLDDKEAIVIDFKTGRQYGNEVKHDEQLRLYQLVTFLRYPKLEKITAELWYLDQNATTSKSYTRSQGLRFREGFHSRGIKLTTNLDWKPNPSIFTCRWCPFLNTEHCTVGVSKGGK